MAVSFMQWHRGSRVCSQTSCQYMFSFQAFMCALLILKVSAWVPRQVPIVWIPCRRVLTWFHCVTQQLLVMIHPSEIICFGL